MHMNKQSLAAEASLKFLITSAEKQLSRLSKFQVCGYGANLFTPLCSETQSAQPHISAFLQLRLSKSELKSKSDSAIFPIDCHAFCPPVVVCAE